MTTKKELLAKIAELQAKVDEMPDEFRIETVRAYEPLALRKEYWLVGVDGATFSAQWEDDAFDRARLLSGQAFLTEEAAEREAKRKHLWHQCRKAMKEAWEAFGEMPDWTNNVQPKHCVYIDEGEVDRIELVAAYERIHFPTEESLNAWRSTVTDDDIKLMLIEEW